MTPFADLEKMARAVAASGLFPGLRTVEQAITLCLLAEADGQHPVTGARDYHIISGRPALKADAMLARFQTAGGKVEWHEYSDHRVAARFSHPAGGTVDIDWTLERAATAGLKSETWKKYPRALLRARVCSEGIRAVCPGVLQGMYTPEEVTDMVESNPPPPPAVDTVALSSQDRLTAMKNHVDHCTTIDSLTQWWRDNTQARNLLTPEHVEELKQHCAARKAALLEANHENKKPGGDSPLPNGHAHGRQSGSETQTKGASGGASPPPVSPALDGEDTPSAEEVATVRRLAVEAGVTDERLAAWVKAATRDLTDNLDHVNAKILLAIRTKIEKSMMKTSGPTTVEGTIIPDGYRIDTQAHIFDADALNRGEFVEIQ